MVMFNSSGWWFQPLRHYSRYIQLGLLFPINGKIKMFQTTNQNSINLHCCWLNHHFPMVFLCFSYGFEVESKSSTVKHGWTMKTNHPPASSPAPCLHPITQHGQQLKQHLKAQEGSCPTEQGSGRSRWFSAQGYGNLNKFHVGFWEM
jgi:hypothetical protein